MNQLLNVTSSRELTALTDKDLYALSQQYGQNARFWKQKFAGLLPEVLHRKLYNRRGFASLYEFAFKIGGLNHLTVDKVLSLHARLQDKPALKEQLIMGSIGWSKIERVSYLATPETDQEWASKIQVLSKPALEAYIKAQKFTKIGNIELLLPGQEAENIFELGQEVWRTISFPISPQVEKELQLTKLNLEREKRKKMTLNQVIHFLIKMKTVSKQITTNICPDCAAQRARTANSRPIPSLIRRLIEAQYKGYCAFPHCDKPSTSLHHTKRYALNPSHNPKGIVPLCTEHEQLVHSGLIENEEDPPEKWRVLPKADPKNPKYQVDRKVQKYRHHSS